MNTDVKTVHNQILSNAGLPTQSLKLRVITFNLGDNKKTQDQWLSELQTWKELNQMDYDILSFALQEDFADMLESGHLIKALTMYLENHYMLAVSDSTKPLKFNEPFSVKAATFVRKDIYAKSFIQPTTYIPKKSICLGAGLKRLACTKASVGISVRFGAPYNLNYTFIGSHMPIETKTPDLGYQARLDAMNQTINAIVKPLLFPLVNNSNTLLVWAGDLNFRKDLQSKDQLAIALQQNIDAGFGNQTGFGIGLEENIKLLSTIQPTCKLVTCNGANCPNCRRHPEIANSACYDSGAKHGKEPKVPRLPSNCDRVLYRFWPSTSKPALLDCKEYAAFVESAVLQSDHNAVKADFTILQ